MIVEVYVGEVISSAKILAKSSVLLLIGALIPKDTGSGCTHARRGMVVRVVQEGDAGMLLTATSTTLATALEARIMRKWGGEGICW